MRDDDLTNLLRQIPPESASPGFTDRVLARIDAPRPRRWATLAAAAALALAAGLGALHWESLAAQSREDERLASVRAEYAQLSVELARLEQEASARRPILYLGGTERVELVLDLGAHPIFEDRSSGAIRPAIERATSKH